MTVVKAILIACIVGLTAATVYHGRQLNQLEQLLDDLSALDAEATHNADPRSPQGTDSVTQDLQRCERRILALEKSFQQLARTYATARYDTEAAATATTPPAAKPTPAPAAKKRARKRKAKSLNQYQRARRVLATWASEGVIGPMEGAQVKSALEQERKEVAQIRTSFRAGQLTKKQWKSEVEQTRRQTDSYIASVLRDEQMIKRYVNEIRKGGKKNR